MSMMDNEQPHQELVKCVVVGDTAVGKTRLICARACNQHVSLSQLLTTHVPTVWAIDQYRIYKDVLERSWEVVDSVNVSLRLWDTFGDHEKDRRFAYGRSDVVLLCFSINNPMSLKNCLAMWYPEIRRFCPQTPVLLIGCKNDLRHMHRDATYLNLVKDRSPLVRPTRQSDLVMPDKARAVARELGVFYYETSVLTSFGVNEAFENAIRAALLARRNQRFWMTNLRKVQRPLLQAPYLPPKPNPPEIYVSESSFHDDLLSMWLSPIYSDVIIVANNVGFTAHRFVLAAASPVFCRLLSAEISELGARSSSDSSMTSSTLGEATLADFNEDTECLIRTSNKPSKAWEQLKRRSSCQTLPSSNTNNNNYYVCRHRDLDHPGFDSICVKPRTDRNVSQTVLKTTKLITPLALNQCLQFIYTGSTSFNSDVEMQDLRQAAEFLKLYDLLAFINNVQAREEFLNVELKIRFLNNMRVRLKDLCMHQGLFADVVFQLDDGTCYSAHRPLLIQRCDVMRAMFTGDFRESAAKVVFFPGVNDDSFFALLSYLYSDELPSIAPQRCVDLLELANRLCLPRLINLIEDRIVMELTNADDVMELCLRILEPCKLHNAHQLADWCMNYLCTNYNKLCKRSPKLLKMLHFENQEYLKEHRWPPVWYLKDYDYYEKCLGERQREEKLLKKRGAGCLFFSSNKAKKQSKELVVEVENEEPQEAA